MRKILLTVAYDGTDFHGFAHQDGVRTVEGALADAVFEITKEHAEIIGASRTDAGVHAYGNLAVFDTDADIPAERIPYALNTALPEDVRVVQAEEVAEDFHPRKTGWKKTYEYRIYNAPWPDPTQRRYTYHYRSELNVMAMAEAVRYLCGEHDFTSFCSVHSQSETRTRTIFDADVFVRKYANDIFDERKGTALGTGISSIGSLADKEKSADNLIIIRVTGSGFLYHMVRIIAGTLLDIGRGRTSPADIPALLAARDRSAAGATLPPEGLFLIGYTRM